MTHDFNIQCIGVSSMKKNNYFLDKIEKVAIILCFAFMTAMNFINVVSRKFFANSFSFTEELTIMAFVWITMLGISAGYKKHAHLGMDYLVSKFSEKGRKIFIILSSVCSFILAIVMIYYGIGMVKNQIALKSATPALGLPSAFQGASIPLGGLLILFRVIEDLLFRKNDLLSRKEG